MYVCGPRKGGGGHAKRDGGPMDGEGYDSLSALVKRSRCWCCWIVRKEMRTMRSLYSKHFISLNTRYSD